MKSFIAKCNISILVNLRYFRFKLVKYKENYKKICNTFNHNCKSIPLYIKSNVSLERYYFVLSNGALTSEMSKMVLNAFCDKTLHLLFWLSNGAELNNINALLAVNWWHKLIIMAVTSNHFKICASIKMIKLF